MYENYEKQIDHLDWDLPDILFSKEEMKENFPNLQNIEPRLLRLEMLKYERYQEFLGLWSRVQNDFSDFYVIYKMTYDRT